MEEAIAEGGGGDEVDEEAMRTMPTLKLGARPAEMIQELQDRDASLTPFKYLRNVLEAGKEVPPASLPAEFSREDIYFDHD